LTSRTLALKIAEQAVIKKAQDVVMMDLRKMQAATDFFVICSGDSDTHLKAIAEGIEHGLEREGVTVWRSEGFRSLQWVLLDYVDVVVHVFHKETRSFYNLERLWDAAPVSMVEDAEEGTRVVKQTRRKTAARKKPTTAKRPTG
jgi:ribosome-associated protein